MLAFGFAIPIAILGGLIGLGGAEFRLPVLVGPLGYRARQAVPLNLAVSLVTIVTSLVIRTRSLSLVPLQPLLPVLLALAIGAMIAAFFGTGLFERLSEHALERIIQGLLLVIGLVLLLEAMTTSAAGALLPAAAWLPAAVLFGLAIGTVSSLLGVAGGEVIIPTLIFAYGVDIKTAGTASLLVSLPTVLVGIARHQRRGAYTRLDVLQTVAPMGAGSIIGALIGGLLVGLIAVSLLKALLGGVLIVSALRMFRPPGSSLQVTRCQRVPGAKPGTRCGKTTAIKQDQSPLAMASSFSRLEFAFSLPERPCARLSCVRLGWPPCCWVCACWTRNWLWTSLTPEIESSASSAMRFSWRLPTVPVSVTSPSCTWTWMSEASS